eukprot:INCI5673.1.p1 GENE.INCI5673.1~~INCI5673.1.p1  ORF type:complete len:372 (-),score=69.66 INCI5673.1:169-1284(-)
MSTKETPGDVAAARGGGIAAEKARAAKRKKRVRQAKLRKTCPHKIVHAQLLPALDFPIPHAECSRCGQISKCRQGPWLWRQLVEHNRDPVGVFAVRLAKHEKFTHGVVGSESAVELEATRRARAIAAREAAERGEVVVGLPQGYTANTMPAAVLHSRKSGEHSAADENGTNFALAARGILTDRHVAASSSSSPKKSPQRKGRTTSPVVVAAARAAAVRRERSGASSPSSSSLSPNGSPRIPRASSAPSPHLAQGSAVAAARLRTSPRLRRVTSQDRRNGKQLVVSSDSDSGGDEQPRYDISDDSEESDSGNELEVASSGQKKRKGFRHLRKGASGAQKWRQQQARKRKKRKSRREVVHTASERESKACAIM